jgi:hypothetical protein
VQDPTSDLSQQVGEAGGSPTRETPERAGAASTTPRRSSTARWGELGKQDGAVYERRNQWWNPLKKSDRLGTWLMAGIAVRRTPLQPGRTVSAPIAPGTTVKSCGVVAVMPAGEKLGTYPVDRSTVNVGTAIGSPTRRPSRSAQARYVVYP